MQEMLYSNERNLPPEQFNASAEGSPITPLDVVGEQINLAALLADSAHAVAPTDSERVTLLTASWMFPQETDEATPIDRYVGDMYADERLGQNIHYTIATTNTRWQQYIAEQLEQHRDDDAMTDWYMYLADLPVRPRSGNTIQDEFGINPQPPTTQARAQINAHADHLPSYLQDHRAIAEIGHEQHTAAGKVARVGAAWLMSRGSDALIAATVLPMAAAANYLEHHTTVPYNAAYLLAIGGGVLASDAHGAWRKYRALKSARMTTDTISTLAYNFTRATIPQILLAQWLYGRVFFAGSVALAASRTFDIDLRAMLVAKAAADIGISQLRAGINYAIEKNPLQDVARSILHITRQHALELPSRLPYNDSRLPDDDNIPSLREHFEG